METHERFERPSPAEAAAALEAARQARAAGHAPIPTWFFLVYGLMAAVLILGQPVSGFIAIAASAAYAVGIVVTQCVYNRRVDEAGIVPRNLTVRQTVIMTGPVAALWIAGALLEHRWEWTWITGAVLGGCWTVGYGLVHNRRLRTSA